MSASDWIIIITIPLIFCFVSWKLFGDWLGDISMIWEKDTYLQLQFIPGLDIPNLLDQNNIYISYVLCKNLEIVNDSGEIMKIKQWSIFIVFERKMECSTVKITTNRSNFPHSEVKDIS